MVGIFGIVNVTRDSFSDGGRFLATDRALAHAEALLQAGADVLDLGAESTHPDAEDVPAAVEIERLEPLVRTLVARGAIVSIDTCKAAVMAHLAALGATFWNDVNGLRDPEALATAAALPTTVRFVVMFSRAAGGRAERGTDDGDPTGTFAAIGAFFAERIAACEAAGIDRRRLVLDPGMGFFLGPTPAPSLHVLRHLDELRTFGLPLLVSVSRKSFLGALSGAALEHRGPPTLAAELCAARRGADYLRTHDVAALRAALAVQDAIEGAP
ncbi:MAG: dihydropteroate synthase [Planctomycetes bacterium]|nr:dihydropteroate synthase [Planctomycetota bacterium]